ncbi:MAG: putative sulfate exporter family transporter [Gammaproteobacteria bacterium]|nr:putative sulfate exporter family transporter [Gammaproteobacteria bacterium]
MSMEAAGFAFELALAGICAAFRRLHAVLAHHVRRQPRLFRLPREWAACLASGISICGVSAAIATGGAIRAKPIIPVMISMLIVVFAMIELIILPGLFAWFAPNEPIVNGAALGLTVKTDGADAAAGAILDELMRADAASRGIEWQEGWILAAAVMTKIWIDIFIGVWAFILALIWVYKVERNPGQQTVGASEIWFRFPKFVLGYLLTWFVYLGIAMFAADLVEAASVGAETVQSPMRKMMFMLTFVSIGVVTDFSKLRGMGRLALLYGLGLAVVIIPLGYFIAWVFHRGMMPPA